MGPSLIVDIGKRFRGWMGVEKYSIEERISMIRISYSLLRMNIGKHEREQPKAIETNKQLQTYLIIENTLAYQ